MHLMSLRYQLFQEWGGTLKISIEKDIDIDDINIDDTDRCIDKDIDIYRER